MLDTFDDDGLLDYLARDYLVASGPNRGKILKHPACLSEDGILAHIDSKLAQLQGE